MENTNNSIINAAMPLITLMLQIKRCKNEPNVKKCRIQMINGIKLFSNQLTNSGFNSRTILAAQYCLCTAIDEAILNTNWGTQSIWVGHTLLSLFHKEAWGGERFYIILNEMLKKPRQNINIIEFIYLLLNLGFEGKFFNQGKMICIEIKNRTFQYIKKTRGKIPRTLATNITDSHIKDNNRFKTISLKTLFLSASFGLLFIAFIFNIQAYRDSFKLLNELNHIGRVSPITIFSQLINRPIIPHSFDRDSI